MNTIRKYTRPLIFTQLADVLFTAIRVSRDGRWIGIYATGLALDGWIAGVWLLFKVMLLSTHAKTNRLHWGWVPLSIEMLLGAGLSVYDIWLLVGEPCACNPVPPIVWLRLLWNLVILCIWGYGMNRGGYIRPRV